MSNNINVANYTFSDLAKVIQELTRLQKENIDLLFELTYTKHQFEQAKNLAQIESKVYSGIKKFFK